MTQNSSVPAPHRGIRRRPVVIGLGLVALAAVIVAGAFWTAIVVLPDDWLTRRTRSRPRLDTPNRTS
jgi:hypothetical protein